MSISHVPCSLTDFSSDSPSQRLHRRSADHARDFLYPAQAQHWINNVNTFHENIMFANLLQSTVSLINRLLRMVFESAIPPTVSSSTTSVSVGANADQFRQDYGDN